MDFATIGTIGNLISATIGATKNARELAKDSSDNELKEQIGKIYDSLSELKEQVLVLDDENRKLKDTLAEKAAYIGPIPPHGYIYESSDSEHQYPLCATCYQSTPKRIAFMDAAEPWNRGIRRTCQLCGKHIYEKPMDFSKTRAVAQSPFRY